MLLPFFCGTTLDGMIPKPTMKRDESASTGIATDVVNEASEDSFPASDAPSWTVMSGEKDSSQLEVEPSQEGCDCHS